MDINLKPIAKIYTDFPEKFGIPRQSGLVKTSAKIIFEPEYRNPDAVRGLQEFSYIWLLWQFIKEEPNKWSPTVRPPRLGGNERLGVFATRSPNRPNPIGLSSVKLIKTEQTTKGPVIYVSGADILNGTPIFDIKPYLKYADCHLDANNGFTDCGKGRLASVIISNKACKNIPSADIEIIKQLLFENPKPSYQTDIDRTYAMLYKNYEVKFKVSNNTATVTEIIQK